MTYLNAVALNDPIFWGVAVLMLIAAGMLVLLGACIAFAAAPSGRQWAAMAPCALALIAAFLGFIVGDIAGDFNTEWAGPVGAGVCFLLCTVPGFFVALGSGDGIRAMVKESEEIPGFAIPVFDVLDVDGDKQINRGDLEKAVALPRWTDNELRLLKHISDNWSEIGHDIGSTDYITLMPVGSSLVPMSTSTTIRAINVDDLRSYPERLRTKWHKWL